MNDNAGNGSTAVGYRALEDSTGARNVGLGYEAGYSVTSGADNIMIGHQAGVNLTTGNQNVGIGKQVTIASGATNCIAIGSSARCDAGNTIAIGNGVIATTTNDIVIGTSTHDSFKVCGNTGFANYSGSVTSITVKHGIITSIS